MEYFLFLCFKSSSRSSRTVLWSTTLHLTTHQHGVFWVNCSFNLNTPSNKEKPSHSPIVSSPIKLFRPPLLVSTWSLLVWPGLIRSTDSDWITRHWSLVSGFWFWSSPRSQVLMSLVGFQGCFLWIAVILRGVTVVVEWVLSAAGEVVFRRCRRTSSRRSILFFLQSSIFCDCCVVILQRSEWSQSFRLYSGSCPAHPVEREEKREEEREEDGWEVKEREARMWGGGGGGEGEKKQHVRWGAGGVRRRWSVPSCSLNQNWVRHSCILRRPFQVHSVTQSEAVVFVIMATRERAVNLASNCRCAGSIM